MLEAKKWYMVGVAVPSRAADEEAGLEARPEVVVVEPRIERLTESEAKPINIIARDDIHKKLKGIERQDVEVMVSKVESLFPFV